MVDGKGIRNQAERPGKPVTSSWLQNVFHTRIALPALECLGVWGCGRVAQQRAADFRFWFLKGARAMFGQVAATTARRGGLSALHISSLGCSQIKPFICNQTGRGMSP